MLKTTALVALVCSFVAGAGQALVDCAGCAAEGGVGLASPATPNNPNANGAGNPPSGTPATTVTVADIDAPPSASGSWRMQKSGNGRAFESTAGKCKANDSDATDAPPCIQDASCTWKLKKTSTGGATSLTITITSKSPSGGGTTGPSPSSGFTQTQGATPPEWTKTFSSGDAPMEPGCGGETEFVVCWNEAGTPQRWELSFRCTKCLAVQPAEPVEIGGGSGGGGGDGTGGGE